MNHPRSIPPFPPSRWSASLFFAGLTAAIVWMAAVTAPAQDTGAPDPVPVDYGMIKVGESLFRAYCTSCHGPTAEGDGPLAESLRVPPANLTMLKKNNSGEFPFEETTKKIDGRERVKGHGSSDMPTWGKVFTKTDEDASEEKVHDKVLALTHYIRSLQAL